MVVVRSPGHVYLYINNIYYCQRYTCAHDIIYTIPMIYNDALLLLIIAQSVNIARSTMTGFNGHDGKTVYGYLCFAIHCYGILL